jgi:hypothetical protein
MVGGKFDSSTTYKRNYFDNVESTPVKPILQKGYYILYSVIIYLLVWISLYSQTIKRVFKEPQ